MKTKKKNRFFTFIFSCMPGAGEMYMGFMNRGVSMMLLFILTIVVSVWIEQAAILAICVVEWFFSFFYVNHLASLNDEEFAMVEDKSIFGTAGLHLPETQDFVYKYNKAIACVLIFLGCCFLWNTFARILSWILPEQLNFISRTMRVLGDYLPSIAIGFGIIFLGFKMLEGKKIEVVPNVQENEKETVRENAAAEENAYAEKFVYSDNFSKSEEVKEMNARDEMPGSGESRKENQEVM